MRHSICQTSGLPPTIENFTPLKTLMRPASMKSALLCKQLYKDALGKSWLSLATTRDFAIRASRTKVDSASAKIGGSAVEEAAKSKKVNFSCVSYGISCLHIILLISMKHTHPRQTLSVGTGTWENLGGAEFKVWQAQYHEAEQQGNHGHVSP